uniref:Aldehyde dehydrogenase n=1 Tax=Aceria tosichella TaxID=561515 RepID=A0A6G1SHX4_9ACAR
MPPPASPASQFDEVLGRARRAFASGITKSPVFRKEQLKQLYKLLEENESDFVEALKKDLKKPRFESVMTEVDFVLNDIRSALNNLDSWMRPKFVSKCFVTLVDDNYIYYEPYGVVLVLGAWNYPIQLAFSPLVGAIAAGNACIVKPSEIAPATGNLIQRLLPLYMDREAIHCVMGDGACAQALVASPQIDYVFFTGSSQIGRLIYQAASNNITPCTLEMGGKSPVFIDEKTYYNAKSGHFDAQLFETTVRRILWGKFLNTGQTCVAPDYVLCSRLMADKFMEFAPKIIDQFYGDNPIKNQDYGRIVSSRHYQRLVSMLKQQLELNDDSNNNNSNNNGNNNNRGQSSPRTVIGGKYCVDESGGYFIEPTVLLCSSSNDPLMQTEIFGPILPIVPVNDHLDAISFINSRDKPLSMYLFTKRDELIRQFREDTSSGSICVNDTVIHLIAEALPFGGVGKSGIGAYHGKHSFKTFSHQKSVLVRGFNPIIEWVAKKRYPPYSENHLRRMLRLLKRRSSPIDLSSRETLGFLCFIMGVLLCFLSMSISAN